MAWHGLLNGTLRGVEYLPTSYWLERISEVSKTTQAIAPGCPAELNGKTLQLKTRHTLDKGHRKRSDCNWPENSLPAGSFSGAGRWYAGEKINPERRRHQWSYPVLDPEGYKTELPGMTCLLRHEGSGGWSITFWLDLGPATQEGIHDWCCKPGQKSKAWEVKIAFSAFIFTPTVQCYSSYINSLSQGSGTFWKREAERARSRRMGEALRNGVLCLPEDHCTPTHYSLASVQG